MKHAKTAEISTLSLHDALPISITHTTTGATGIGVPVSLPAGVTAAWAANTITIRGTPTASGTFNYSNPQTRGLGSLNATITITVTLTNTFTTVSTSTTSWLTTS